MSTNGDTQLDTPPLFKAISSTARQLFQLLNCIRFAPKAHIQISPDGLQFSVDESRVMQGVVWLDRKLFTSYTTTLPPAPEPGDDEDPDPDPDPDSTHPIFQISLTSLLETLQIFDSSSPQTRTTQPTDLYTSVTHRDRNHAFSNASLGMSSLCRLSYTSPGSPFSIILEEAGVVTTCSLNTYALENAADIPFDTSAVKVKIILPSRHLHDSITELASTSPSALTLTCSSQSPYLSPIQQRRLRLRHYRL
jgi:cell cycle checkpoint protein